MAIARDERIPHPIPYQGSKRRLAQAILARIDRARPRRLIEPFAGSAAITLAAASVSLCDRFLLGDSCAPLARLWRRTIAFPSSVAERYAALWSAQRPDDDDYFAKVRAAFNRTGDPVRLLYLLARCVKSAPRWNRQGHFNQSCDRRRRGTKPSRMARELLRASQLLRGRSEVHAADFAALLDEASPRDLVYLDPPWEGTSTGRDRRYHRGLSRQRLVAELGKLLDRGVPFVLSYDGRSGERSYGDPLPRELGLRRIELHAGRSAQATLHGRSAHTVESLYLSPSLIRRARGQRK